MIQEKVLCQRIQEYDEAFDYYMDKGQLPNNIPQDDVLGCFIRQTIDDNPQLSIQDSLWQELLKEELMKFIEAMLKLFQSVAKQYCEEKSLIRQFVNGNINTKRSMWREVVSVTAAQYRPEEININGYTELFKDKDRDAVLNALCKDWDKACDEHAVAQLHNILKRNQTKWEQYVKTHSLTDYRERKKTERFFYSYPQLKDIVRIIGREQPKHNDEMDDTVQRYLPILPSAPKPSAEVEEIANGKELHHLLPIETAIMADKETESLFYLKYATRQLQLFASRPKKESQFKTEQRQMKKPRLENGPIIVCVDTSASMCGRPLRIAYAVLLQLLRLARKQKRKCYLITFSVRAKSLDLSFPHNWVHINRFLEDKFSGGTDGEQMLHTTIEMLQTKSYAMADVLIISDFEFSLPVKSTRKKMTDEQHKGTRFYGLRIGCTDSEYNTILDNTWEIK